jgi:hypothetical protein
MGLALMAGMVLARRRHYRAHAFCQSAVVLLNLVTIGLIMVPLSAAHSPRQFPLAVIIRTTCSPGSTQP